MQRLTFLPRFSGKVKSGSSFHTIRSANNSVAVGDKLEFHDDEKGLIGIGRCIGRARILLAPERAAFADALPHARLLPFTGSCSDPETLAAFAKADGFSSYRELTDWVRERYGEMPFVGAILVCEVD